MSFFLLNTVLYETFDFSDNAFKYNSENYDNLTTQVFFNDFDLVVTPGNEFPFTVTENVSFPLPSVTPNITPTPTPTIPVPIL